MSKQLPDAVGDNENYGPRAAGCDEKSKILRDSRVYRAWQSSPRLGADLKVAFFGGSKADCDWVKTVAPGCEVDILEKDDSATPLEHYNVIVVADQDMQGLASHNKIDEAVANGAVLIASHLLPKSISENATSIVPFLDEAADPHGGASADLSCHSAIVQNSKASSLAISAGIAVLWMSKHCITKLISCAREMGASVSCLFREVAMKTARQPRCWDTKQRGEGLIDAGAILRADLSLLNAETPAARPDILSRPAPKIRESRPTIEQLLGQLAGAAAPAS